MPFLKHHLVFYTEAEMNAHWPHVQACSLREVAFGAHPPKTHNYVIRHQGLWAFPSGYALTDMGWDGKDRRVTDGARWAKNTRFEGALKSSLRQDEAFEQTLGALEDSPTGGAILCLPPGHGKTVVSLALLSALRRKAFILVHTRFLAEQWRERIAQFLPGVKVFMWDSGSGQDDDRDAQVGIGLMQTIHRLPSFFFSNYGVLVVDECHHVACQTLQQSIPRFNTRYTLGLSATPDRRDGLTRYLYWMVGAVSFHIPPCYKGVRALVARYCSTPAQRRALGLPADEPLENRIQYDTRRLDFTVSVLQRILQDPARKVLVLTLRRKHAELLTERARGFTAPRLLLGGTAFAPSDLHGVDVVVSTYQLVSEGFDCPHLNTILCAMPKGDLVQVIGRVTRGGVGRVTPWIVDVLDADEHDAVQRFNRRKAQYRALKIELVESGIQ